MPLGLATHVSRWTRCADGIGDASISLDASGGTLPVGVAWNVSRWARSAIGISDERVSVEVSASRCNRI